MLKLRVFNFNAHYLFISILHYDNKYVLTINSKDSIKYLG